jgi:hypothetical protein
MAQFITGMDQHTKKQFGENLHAEYGISNELDEQIVQFFFQLVRNKDHSSLEKLHLKILRNITLDPALHQERLTIMYKLIGQTRDIILGKGEQKLAFMQLYNFYNEISQDLAFKCLGHFVKSDQIKHPYGSWKDIKYFCEYVREKGNSEEHPLIVTAIELGIEQVKEDYILYNKVMDEKEKDTEFKQEKEDYKENPKYSLVCKWLPREKSNKFGWVFKEMARIAYPHYLKSAKTEESKKKAIIKGRIHLNKILTTINRQLETTQIAQCGKDWASIDFNKVTSATIRKQTYAFTYKNKKGDIRGNDKDRLECSKNYSNHIEEIKKGSNKHKMHGRRVNVYELVKDAYDTHKTNTEKIDTINLQWKDNSKNNKGLGNIIPCSDTSYSMTIDDSIPLYNSIGLGIRISEITHEAFKDRMLTFASTPVWHNLSDCNTFCEKVNKVKNFSTGLNTDFYAALKMILDVIVDNDISPDDTENMVLAIFSDMQIDHAIHKNPAVRSLTHVGYMDSMYDCIKELYNEAGLRSKYKKPYNPPHILFWNLRKTEGFPVLSTQRNTSMLSGYNSTLLNVFCEKGVDALKEFTPRKMLKDLLDNERYNILDEDLRYYRSEKCEESISQQ